MTTGFTESKVEAAALDRLGGLGYSIKHGLEIAAGEPSAERRDPNHRDVLPEDGLRLTLVDLDTAPPPEEGAAP